MVVLLVLRTVAKLDLSWESLLVENWVENWVGWSAIKMVDLMVKEMVELMGNDMVVLLGQKMENWKVCLRAVLMGKN